MKQAVHARIRAAEARNGQLPSLDTIMSLERPSTSSAVCAKTQPFAFDLRLEQAADVAKLDEPEFGIAIAALVAGREES